MTTVFPSDGTDGYKGLNFTYQTQSKKSSTGLSTGTVIAIVVGVLALFIIILVIVMCCKRRSLLNHLRSTQNELSEPARLCRPNTNRTGSHTPYVDTVNTQSPPPYSSLIFSMNAVMPAHKNRESGNNIDNPPPPYSTDLPGGTSHQEEKCGAHFNEAFDVTPGDEVVKDDMTEQSVSAKDNTACITSSSSK